MSKKLAVGRRKAAMKGKLSTTKRELADLDKPASQAAADGPRSAPKSTRKARSS